MTRFAAACLPLLLCLLSRPAHSQAVAPLRPVVVQLAAGDVVHQPLVGLDTATYRHTRQYVAAACQLLLVRADRIAQLERSGRLCDSLATAASAELRRQRATVASSEADFQKLAGQASQALATRPQPPLLLDSQTYKGAALGAVAVVLVKLFIFHN